MVIKEIISGEEAHKKVYSGIEKLSKAVGSTFGPAGHNVSLQRDNGELHCTKDGVTVAKEITFEDQIEYSASTYIKDIAQNTVARAGDGTTTAIILASKLYKEMRNEDGTPILRMNPDIKRGMKFAAEHAIEFLKQKRILAKDPEILEKVALIASNNDIEISGYLREAMKILGETGNIFVEESKSTKTHLFTSPGMGLMKGFMSNYFINNSKRMTSELILPYVLVTEDEIFSVFQLQNIFKQIIEHHQRLLMEASSEIRTEIPHILIICKKIKQDILEWVITQHSFKAVNACVIQADHVAENSEQLEALMTDLAMISGCQGIGGKFLKRLGTGKAQCNISDLGRLKKAVINKEKSILIPLPEEGNRVKDFCDGLKQQCEKETNDAVRISLKNRISRLSDGIAILELGGITEKARNERIDRIEDAICAVMVARDWGVLPGGGLPYMQAAHSILDRLMEVESKITEDKYSYDQFIMGMKIVSNALINLTRHLLETNHIPSTEVDNFINHYHVPHTDEPVLNESTDWKGFNLLYGTSNVNLFNEGIIEPVKVNIEAIQNAVDIITMLLDTENFVIYANNQEKKLIYPIKGNDNIYEQIRAQQSSMMARMGV
jgi:chaperonin GroEL